MRSFVFILIFLFSAAVCAADMEPVGTAEAERAAAAAAEKAAAEEATKAAAEAQKAEAERAAKEAAEREAAAKAEREAKEAAERETAAKAEREAKEAAEREATAKAAAEKAAAEEAARAAAQKAAADAERAAKEAAEREAVAKAEREAKEAAEREAAARAEREAKEAAEREAAAKAAASASAVQCGAPVTIANSDAARGIAERAKADANANAGAPEQLVAVARQSVAALSSSYGLDQDMVGRAYLVALCRELATASSSPLPLTSLLTTLTDALGPSRGTIASAEPSKLPPAGGAGQPQAGSQGAPVAAQSIMPKPTDSGTSPEVRPQTPQTTEQKPVEAATAPSAPSPLPAPTASPPASGTTPTSPTTDEKIAKTSPEPAEAKPASPSALADSVAPPTDNPTELQKPGAESTAAKVAPGGLSEDQCSALGVPGKCPDVKATFDQLMEKPLEYNHPKTMLLGHKTEIVLVLRTDWEGKDLPPISEQLKDLPGDVKQGVSKITRVMSAELTGQGFDITPPGRQDRMIASQQAASWSWQVTPSETGKDKTLKLQLYAHLEGPGGAMPPVLVKTLDAAIDVDVTTWDWVINQARMIEPFYTVSAAVIGLLTAIMFFFLFARRRRSAGDGIESLVETGDIADLPRAPDRWLAKRPGPVIGDLSQSAADSRMTPSPQPPKSEPGGSSGGEPGGGPKPDQG